MLFIEEKSSKNLIKIPRNCGDTFETYSLYLYSQGLNKEVSFEVQDLSGLSDYYVFDVDFSNTQEAEYEYEIFGVQDDKELSIGAKGLIQIGDRTIEIRTYENEVNYTYYERGSEE